MLPAVIQRYGHSYHRATAPFPRVVRDLPPGLHPLLALLPNLAASPALTRIASRPRLATLLRTAQVRLDATVRPVDHPSSFGYIDATVPCIVLTAVHYRRGSDLDLYLDLLHELTHLRQLADGADLWDPAYAYVDRPTEIEAYAVAVGEARRLGCTEPEVLRHLACPGLTATELQLLLARINARLAS